MKSFLLVLLLLANFVSNRNGTSIARPAESRGFLFIANQFDHTALVVNVDSRQVVTKTGVDINGHEVVVEPSHRFGYVPIYGNSGVGKPGTDGSTIHVVDLRVGRTLKIIDLGKPVALRQVWAGRHALCQRRALKRHPCTGPGHRQDH
jgi:hypothetical protein